MYEKDPNDPIGITACRAGNTFPCKQVAPSQRPFWKEFEDLTNVDLFQVNYIYVTLLMTSNSYN